MNSNSFEPINSSNLNKKPLVNTNRVIKNSKVNIQEKFTIEARKFEQPKPISDVKNGHNSHPVTPQKIEPIVEKDRIIGIKYRCDCGKIEDIYFEYEEK